MIKVIELVPTLGYGGAEALIKDYALLCDRDRVEIIIVTWSGHLGTANERLSREAGISVIHLEELRYPAGKKLNILQRILRKIGRFLDFRKLVLTEKPDVIHMHLRIGAYMRFLPLKKLGVRLIYTVHNPLERYFDKRPFRKKWFEYMECNRLIHRHNMLMITLYDEMNRLTKAFFSTQNVLTLHNGINLERFDGKKEQRDRVREQLGIGRDEYVIGHIGSVTAQKNHDYVLDLFTEYASHYDRARLLLIGKGTDKPRILERIKECGYDDKITFLEGRSDIPELMGVMDVFILPSRFEGYPVVTLEAQAMELPCVLSDRITRECILTDRVAMLPIDVPVGEWCDVIDGIRAGKTDMCCSAMGSLEDYDIKKCINRLEDIYSGKLQ